MPDPSSIGVSLHGILSAEDGEPSFQASVRPYALGAGATFCQFFRIPMNVSWAEVQTLKVWKAALEMSYILPVKACPKRLEVPLGRVLHAAVAANAGARPDDPVVFISDPQELEVVELLQKNGCPGFCQPCTPRVSFSIRCSCTHVC